MNKDITSEKQLESAIDRELAEPRTEKRFDEVQRHARVGRLDRQKGLDRLTAIVRSLRL